jgi:hypothetical protein
MKLRWETERLLLNIKTNKSYSKLKKSFKERCPCNSSVHDSSFSALAGHLIKMVLGLAEDFGQPQLKVNINEILI